MPRFSEFEAHAALSEAAERSKARIGRRPAAGKPRLRACIDPSDPPPEVADAFFAVACALAAFPLVLILFLS